MKLGNLNSSKFLLKKKKKKTEDFCASNRVALNGRTNWPQEYLQSVCERRDRLLTLHFISLYLVFISDMLL